MGNTWISSPENKYLKEKNELQQKNKHLQAQIGLLQCNLNQKNQLIQVLQQQVDSMQNKLNYEIEL